MLGSPSLPAQSQRPMNIPAHRGATNEQAIPVPYSAGVSQVLGIKWITDHFNDDRQPISSGGGKGATATAQEKVYSSAAGLFGNTQDCIYAILLNNEIVWPLAANQKPVKAIPTDPTLVRDGSHPDFVIIDNIPNFTEKGAVRLYWGTDTQLPDPYLCQLSGKKHSAYRGFCYAVFQNVFLGYDQDSFQNVQFVMGRFPTHDFLTASENIEGDANPIHVICDWLLNPRLIAAPKSFLNAEALNTVAQKFAGGNFGLSPLRMREQPAKDLLLEFCDQFDGAPLVDENGLFGIQLNRPAADVDALPVIDAEVLLKRPQPMKDSQAVNLVNVQFTNREIDLQPDVEPYRNPGARSINEEIPVPVSLSRPDVTRRKVAAAMAQAYGHSNGDTQITGKLTLRRTGTLFDDLAPGALFKIDVPDVGVAADIFRVTERRLPFAKAEFEISYKVDRSFLFPTIEVEEGRPGDVGGDSETSSLTVAQARIVELPIALCPEGKIALAILAARPSGTATGIAVHLAKNYAFVGDPAQSYAQIATLQRFALHGKLTENFPATIGAIDSAIGLSIQVDGNDSELDEQTDFDAMADSLLVFIGDEIFSVFDWRIEGPGKYRLFCARERFATPRQAHAIDDEAFIIRREDLVALQHPHFRVYNTARFKLAAISANETTDLADADPIDLEIAGRIYTEPALSNLRVNGEMDAVAYETGGDLFVAWTLADGGRDYYQRRLMLVHILLEFYDGATLLATLETGEVNTFALDNATLISTLGSEISFTLKAIRKVSCSDLAGDFILYSEPVSIEVTKI